MTETLQLHEGDLAWHPSEATVEAVLDVVDVPTVGILREGDHHFAFACLDGIAAHLSLWAYTEIGPQAAVGGPIDDALMALFHRASSVVFAVADRDGHVLRTSGEVNPEKFDGSSLLLAATEVMSGFDLQDFGIEKDEVSHPTY